MRADTTIHYSSNDIQAVVTRRRPGGGYELLASNGARYPAGEIPASGIDVSAGWSPSGDWVGLLTDGQLRILGGHDLTERWRSAEEDIQSCCWDWRQDRFLTRRGEYWRSRVLAKAVSQPDAVPLLDFENTGQQSARGNLLIELPSEDYGSDVEETLAGIQRVLLLGAQRFAGTPLVELPVVEVVRYTQWSDDGNVLAWTDSNGLSIWRNESSEVRCLLQWLQSPIEVSTLRFSPSGEHILVVLGSLDTSLARVLVVRIADGAIGEIGSLRGRVGIAEWNGDREVVIGYDFAPEPGGGGWGYRASETVHLGEMPVPGQLAANVEWPLKACLVTTRVPHRGLDYTCVLRGWADLRTRIPFEIVLRDPDSGRLIGRYMFDRTDMLAPEIGALVVIRSITVGRYLLAGINEATSAIVALLWFDLTDVAPSVLELAIQVSSDRTTPDECLLRVPVLTAPASFQSASEGVENIAIWVRTS
jgi:hypothetical protein